MLLLQETERTRGSDVLQVAAIGQLHLESLVADQRMGKVDGIADRIAFGGINANELIAFTQLVRPQNLQVRSLLTLLPDARARNHFDEGQGAAIKDGQFQVVELDDGVVHTDANESRQQVLGGGDEHALLHQAGGVAYLGNIAADGLNGKAFEVGAPEDDSCAGLRRKDLQMNGSPAVQANSAAFDRVANCALVGQTGTRLKAAHTKDYKLETMVGCCILATSGAQSSTCPLLNLRSHA